MIPPALEPPPAPGDTGPERRVLVFAPLGNDARLTARFLREGAQEAVVCQGPEQLCAEASAGCGAWLIAEEALNEHSVALLREWLQAQPSWSEIPIVLITSGGGEVSSERRRRLAAFRRDGNVIFLERPFRPDTLVGTLEVAMRSRVRQYQVRDLLEQTRRDAETLREADRRKDEFLAMLAHELRNPLSSVAHAATLLLDGADESERAWAAGVIARQSGQLARLVEDLLDVSRITRGQIELRPRVFDAADAIARACETVAPLIARRSHRLETTFRPGELWLHADPTRIEQIVVNLLANAAKYTRPNGRIWLDARTVEREIVISIRDSGIGIPPEKIPAMFELFAQGERSTARTEGGLGIGLTVVRGLCELHGGSVSATSGGTNRGSTFTVRLPAVPAPSADAGSGTVRGSVRADAAAAHARVLLVDDNIDTAEALARLLKRRGYEVELAHDGPSALEAARVRCPAAVLLDIGLPEMDGYEVARRLRAEADCAGTLLVALTGYGQEEDRARARASGFDFHMVKPIDVEQLAGLLSEKLSRSEG